MTTVAIAGTVVAQRLESALPGIVIESDLQSVAVTS